MNGRHRVEMYPNRKGLGNHLQEGNCGKRFMSQATDVTGISVFLPMSSARFFFGKKPTSSMG